MSTSKSEFDLTRGPILPKLVRLSLPIMATSFMQMAYNLTDMFWLSRLSEGAVAAAGIGGQFLWLSMSMIPMGIAGSEIGVSQSMGRAEPETAKKYAQNSFFISMVWGIFFALLILLFNSQMISFFGIEDLNVVRLAEQYLAITALAVPFIYTHTAVTGCFNGFGNTKLPFYIDSFAFGLNIALSPVLIFVFDLGVAGAAWGTVVAAAVNLLLKLIALKHYKNRPFEKYSYFKKPQKNYVRQIFRWGFPIALEAALFTFIFMMITRLISDFGYNAVAAHQVGIQIEALSFMVCGGFGSALTAFVGQNFGAKKWGRLRSTYKVAYVFMGVYGVFISLLLFIFASPLVSLFLTYPESIEIGTNYLRIIAIAQLLFCLESVATGSFQGRGLTMKPTIVSVVSNVLRIPICYALSATALGITGVWWGIALAMTIRSVWLLIWHKINIRKIPKADEAIEKV
ncbi:MAG: MATE family efflux transporter [Defluviitaleaceae bacterium]|nr:MATE family efflux transporter [Defluviitaleaceae bacterium]